MSVDAAFLAVHIHQSWGGTRAEVEILKWQTLQAYHGLLVYQVLCRDVELLVEKSAGWVGGAADGSLGRRILPGLTGPTPPFDQTNSGVGSVRPGLSRLMLW